MIFWSSPARVRNSPWFSQKFPCYGFKIPWGYSPFQFHSSPMLGARCCERNDTKTKHETHKRQTIHTPARGTELRKLIVVYYYKSPLGRIPDCMNKPFQYSAGAYMLSYSKGEWISVYCRVCPKPPSPSYLKKGLFPRLQGTIKLTAVSRLFGRTPHM